MANEQTNFGICWITDMKDDVGLVKVGQPATNQSLIYDRRKHKLTRLSNGQSGIYQTWNRAVQLHLMIQNWESRDGELIKQIAEKWLNE